MDTQRQHEQEQNRPPDEQILRPLIDEEGETTNDIPVVRTNTPRPLSFARSSSAGEPAPAAANFPVEAPGAPPLPEEPEESKHEAPATTNPADVVNRVPTVATTTSEQTGESAPEFSWLFEYGLEMDEGYLNSPGRLDGQAHLYGPAVLRGYRIESVRLQNGQAAVTLAKDSSPEREVWGVLYRIPRRLAEQSGSEPSLLDKVHETDAIHRVPTGVMNGRDSSRLYRRAVHVVVQEMYRKRAVQCITYMLSETGRTDFASSATVEAHLDLSYARRLLEVARRQRLPVVYLQALANLTGQKADEPIAPVAVRAEQNTEPLPVLDNSLLPAQLPAPAPSALPVPTPRGWLLALALYLVGILMAALALAVIQTLGYWNQLFTASFAPLGAPWYVLLYGLLGGCISCIMALARSSQTTVPGFVILTWFARPFLGMVLAALAYLVLSSGLFIISVVPTQRYAIYSVVGAVAGLCEGWLFFRWK